MPRFAATILGFMLVAFSIGFNTVRYPVVWDMVSPVRTSESVRPAVAAPPEKPESPASASSLPVVPSSRPATPIVKPAPAVTDKNVADKDESAEAKPASGNVAEAKPASGNVAEAKPASGNVAEAKPASGNAAVAEPEVQRPLVPVVPVSSSGVAETAAAGGAGVCRLPPVIGGDAGPVNRDPGPSVDRSVPIYPTTGIK